ncbi:InlB B-repeat-containing protein [Butyrivibrio sp. AC2005]|uniref:InlB B-repeat-containing protein n=1 Tax=Butyrivibrio sp. AC2005 TaxID=1280672 RepID=UPI000478897C|nr:InlB B-repeat-containing protein [Butyrivibrio sp. AC2005]
MCKKGRKSRFFLLSLALMILVSMLSFAGISSSAKTTKKVTVGQTLTLKAGGLKGKVKWTSSNKKIAKVSKKGVVTGRKVGTATITAKAGKKTKSFKVKVEAGLAIENNNIEMEPGQEQTIKLKGTKTTKVTSSAPEVATVTKKGKITAVSAGEATITFTGKDKKKYKCLVTVKENKDSDKKQEDQKQEDQKQEDQQQDNQQQDNQQQDNQQQQNQQQDNQQQQNQQQGNQQQNQQQGNQLQGGTKEYTVTFVTNGGTNVASQKVPAGGKVSIPAAPTKEGYTFDGWHIDNACQNRFDFSTPINSDIKLYAKWVNIVSRSSYTRGEWVAIIADMAGMNLNTDPNEINYYYGDTAGTEYAIAIETAQRYGVLPSADMENEEDVALFHPSEPATREFAAYVIVKILGYEENLPSSAPCADWDDVQYKPQTYVAIEEGILNTKNGANGKIFAPKTAANETDLKAIKDSYAKADAATRVENAQMGDRSEYTASVVREDFENVTSYRVEETAGGYTVYIPKSTGSLSANIQEGKVALMPENSEHPAGFALLVNSVSTTDSDYVLTGTAPEVEDVFTTIDYSGYATAVVGDIQPAEGVTMTVEQNDGALNSWLDGHINKTATTSLGSVIHSSFDYDLGDNTKAKVDIDVSIPEIMAKIDMNVRQRKVNEFMLQITEELKFDGTITNNGVGSVYQLATGNNDYKGGQFELGRVPFAIGTTGLTVDIVLSCNVSAQGEIHVGYTFDMLEGYHYVNGRGRQIKDFKKDLTTLEIKASLEAGVGLGAELRAFELIYIVGYNCEGGMGLNASFTAHERASDTLYCGEVITYFYFKHGLDSDSAVGKVLDWLDVETSFEPLKNDDDNPYRQKLHVENGVIVDECTFGMGVLEGYVQDASTQAKLKDAKIELYKDNLLIRSKMSDANGKYSFNDLASGNYKIVTRVTGYLKFESTVTIEQGSTKFMEVAMMIDRNSTGGDSDGWGTLTGNILNSTNAMAINGVQYEIRSGGNNTTGEVLYSGTFDRSDFSMSLPAGYYTIAFSKDGFIGTSKNFSMVNRKNTVVRVSMYPTNAVSGIDGASMAITLHWGATPSDLDSHLFGPCVDNYSNRFHTWYSSKNYNYNNTRIADLDVDDTSSYGPETTTVRQMNNRGVYSFYIHNYSNRGSTNNNALGLSGAYVDLKIMKDGEVVYTDTFYVPTEYEGTVWHVFDYDATTGMVNPVNTMSYYEKPDGSFVLQSDGDDYVQSDLAEIGKSIENEKDSDGTEENADEAEVTGDDVTEPDQTETVEPEVEESQNDENVVPADGNSDDKNNENEDTSEKSDEEQTTEESNDDQTTGESNAEQATEESNAGQTTEESNAGQTTEESNDDQSSNDTNSGEQSEEPSTEQTEAGDSSESITEGSENVTAEDGN